MNMERHDLWYCLGNFRTPASLVGNEFRICWKLNSYFPFGPVEVGFCGCSLSFKHAGAEWIWALRSIGLKMPSPQSSNFSLSRSLFRIQKWTLITFWKNTDKKFEIDDVEPLDTLGHRTAPDCSSTQFAFRGKIADDEKKAPICTTENWAWTYGHITRCGRKFILWPKIRRERIFRAIRDCSRPGDLPRREILWKYIRKTYIVKVIHLCYSWHDHSSCRERQSLSSKSQILEPTVTYQAITHAWRNRWYDAIYDAGQAPDNV